MEPLLVVTTRSRLKGVRCLPQMTLETLRVRRQLAHTEGVVRWASFVAGPTEFWTITVWNSRHLMQEFMRSQAHGDIMWNITKLLHSFWVLRWRPGPNELGTWSGVVLAPPPEEPPAAAPFAPLDFDPLVNLPHLKAAMNGAGAPTYEGGADYRKAKARMRGATATVVRVRAGRLRAASALWQLVAQRRRLQANPRLLRSAVGVGKLRLGEVCLLTVWPAREDALEMLQSDWATTAAHRWGERYWANEWAAESEFGHWDGLRLRGARSSATRGARSDAVAPPTSTEIGEHGAPCSRGDDVAG